MSKGAAPALQEPNLFSQISELRSEQNARRNLFPKLVARGVLGQAKADFKMRCLEAAIKSLERLESLENDASGAK